MAQVCSSWLPQLQGSKNEVPSLVLHSSNLILARYNLWQFRLFLCTADKDSLDPFPYFAAMRQDYVFDCMMGLIDASENSSARHLVYTHVTLLLASLVVVAESLLSDHSSLLKFMKILMRILEGSLSRRLICITCLFSINWYLLTSMMLV